MLAIRAAASRLGASRLIDCDLHVTLEPCPMCARRSPSPASVASITAPSDPKGGGIEHGPRIFSQPTCHHRPEVYPGIGEREAGELLRAFFRGTALSRFRPMIGSLTSAIGAIT